MPKQVWETHLFANVTHQRAAGARHFVAAFSFVETCFALGVRAFSDTCERHGFLDFQSLVRLTLLLHFLTTKRDMCRFTTFPTGAFPAAWTVQDFHFLRKLRLRCQNVG